MSTPTLVQNAIHIPEDDLFLVSSHGHDYREHTLSGEPKLSIAVDGGLDYARRVGDLFDLDSAGRYEEYCLTDQDPFETAIVNRLLWGTRGKNGDQPLTFKPIASLELAHLEAILDNCPHIGLLHKKVVQYWIDHHKAVAKAVLL